MSLQNSALQNRFGLRCDGEKWRGCECRWGATAAPPRGVSGGLLGVDGWAGAISGPTACFGLVQPGRSSLKAIGPQVSLHTAGLVSTGVGKVWDSCRYSKKPPVTSGDNDGHRKSMDHPHPPPGSHVRFR